MIIIHSKTFLLKFRSVDILNFNTRNDLSFIEKFMISYKDFFYDH